MTTTWRHGRGADEAAAHAPDKREADQHNDAREGQHRIEPPLARMQAQTGRDDPRTHWAEGVEALRADPLPVAELEVAVNEDDLLREPQGEADGLGAVDVFSEHEDGEQGAGRQRSKGHADVQGIDRAGCGDDGGRGQP